MFRTFTYLVIVALCSSAAAQIDRYFPNVSAEFALAWPCMDPNSGPWTAWETHTFHAEPTIEFDGIFWGQLNPPFPTGLIAVDGDRVLYHGLTWFHAPPDTTVVLYDFGLTEGDTAYWDEYYGFGHAIIQTIDTIEVVGRSRKRFHLNNGDTWLEGIGSLMGLLRPWYSTPLGCDAPTYTYCAEYMDEGGVPYTICSDMLLAITMPQEREFQVQPNPSNGMFTLLGGQPGDGFRVLDARGALVFHGRLSGASTMFDMKGRPGFYIVEVAGRRTKVLVE